MVVQTRFFSCRFSISHAKQRPTTAPRRAARVRGTAFPARPWSDAWFAETQNARAIATTYSADEPERLRGPQHDAAWCDEIASWRYPEAWDMLMRRADQAQAAARTVVTTRDRAAI